MAKVTSQCPQCSAWQEGTVSHRVDEPLPTPPATSPKLQEPKPKPKPKPRQAAPETRTGDQKWARAVLRSVGFLWASDINEKLAPFINGRVSELVPKGPIRWWWHTASTGVLVLSLLANSVEGFVLSEELGAGLWFTSVGAHAWVAMGAYSSRDAARDAKRQALRRLITEELHAARFEMLKDGPFGPPQAPPPGQEPQGVDDQEAERLCAKWLANLGEQNVTVTPAKNDGGLDVISSLCVAQVKNYKGSVGVAAVRELVGVASIDGRFPVFFTSGSYTKAALQFAEEAKVYLFKYDAVAGTLDAESSIARKAFAR